MKTPALIIFVLFLSSAVYGQGPYIQSLKHVAEVTLPDTGKITQTPTAITCVVRGYKTIYFAHYSRLQSSAGDFFTKDMKDSVYKSVLTSALREKGVLFSKKNINWNGLQGTEFAFKLHHDSIDSYRYYRCFYFNHSILFTAIWSLDSLRTDDKKITDYFNSVKLTMKPAEIHQDNFSDDVFTGKTVLIILSVFLSCFLIIFILSKIFSKT